MRYIILFLLTLPVIVAGVTLAVFFPSVFKDIQKDAMHYPIVAVDYVTTTTKDITQDASYVFQGLENKIDETTTHVATQVNGLAATTKNTITKGVNAVEGGVTSLSYTVTQSVSSSVQSVISIPQYVMNGIKNGISHVANYTSTQLQSVGQVIDNGLSTITNYTASQWNMLAGLSDQNIFFARNTNETQIEPMIAENFAVIEPAAGMTTDDNPPEEFSYEFDIDESELFAEAVLVPREKTVISSSRDGKIKKIHFDNGDVFKKGDVILEYHCDASQAELEAAKAERQFAKQRQAVTNRLFNMDLASGLETQQSKVEKQMAEAKRKLAESRLNDCIIRANYDGRVVKKLANDNEYTRTDRVLMEVASKGTLDVEFLLPSTALRWVNIGAPITLKLSETERDYNGEIKRIYGEVDPVSQSIQIRAGLDNYTEPLLPGMSGQITIDVEDTRAAGISGFLETRL